MAFVKLDCGILDSTIWFDREARELFLTALLMAEPKEHTMPVPQIEVDTLKETGWSAPAGWYGFVPAAGAGIVRRAGLADLGAGMEALRRLGSKEAESRSPDFDGRRLVRVDHGFLVLNFQKYRDRDYSAKERMKRYRDRERKRKGERDTVTLRHVTQAEGEAEGRRKRKEKSRAPRDARVAFVPPTLNEVRAQVGAEQLNVNAEAFIAFYESRGWKIGAAPMRSWSAALRTWHLRAVERGDPPAKPRPAPDRAAADKRAAKQAEVARELKEDEVERRAAGVFP